MKQLQKMNNQLQTFLTEAAERDYDKARRLAGQGLSEAQLAEWRTEILEDEIDLLENHDCHAGPEDSCAACTQLIALQDELHDIEATKPY